MSLLTTISTQIDRLSTAIGKLTMGLILATTAISAGNAIVRKAFDTSSNALLEIQWYLFAAVFLLASGYTFLKNAHVRIDFVSSRLSPKARNWVDVVGIVTVLFPFCLITIALSWPLFAKAWEMGEMSSNAGGLIRWPVYLMIPLGFALLMLQGLSELIKRVAFLRCQGGDSLAHQESDEEKLALELLAEVEAKAPKGKA